MSGSLKADLLRHEGAKSSDRKCKLISSADTFRLQTVLLLFVTLCGRYFKWNSSVVQHFKRCSVSLRFSDV